MTNKKYIFFDIDGTILTAESEVPPSTKKALKMAQENGHEIFINTGRSRTIVPDEIEELNFDGIISGTGSEAEYKGKCLFKHSFSKEQISRVIDITVKNDMPIIMSAEDVCVGSSDDLPKYIELFTKGEIKAKDVNDFDILEQLPFIKSIWPVVVDDNKDEYCNKYSGISDFIFIDSPFTVDDFDEIIGEDINISKASFKDPDDYSGEITLSKCSKISGIKNLLDTIGADMKDSIAVGDGFNDLKMLEGASLSIAMGNSPKEIKDISDFVTDDIYKDGVYNALKHFNLI